MPIVKFRLEMAARHKQTSWKHKEQDFANVLIKLPPNGFRTTQNVAMRTEYMYTCIQCVDQRKSSFVTEKKLHAYFTVTPCKCIPGLFCLKVSLASRTGLMCPAPGGMFLSSFINNFSGQ